mmetsp:Transcript_70593/g.228880  ORF Transcript_70593/g.228880 Transcript_70593/m.228880 type:complete len:208 (+) Transcript_70593:1359-1982(+)
MRCSSRIWRGGRATSCGSGCWGSCGCSSRRSRTATLKTSRLFLGPRTRCSGARGSTARWVRAARTSRSSRSPKAACALPARRRVVCFTAASPAPSSRALARPRRSSKSSPRRRDAQPPPPPSLLGARPLSRAPTRFGHSSTRHCSRSATYCSQRAGLATAAVAVARAPVAGGAVATVSATVRASAAAAAKGPLWARGCKSARTRGTG